MSYAERTAAPDRERAAKAERRERQAAKSRSRPLVARAREVRTAPATPARRVAPGPQRAAIRCYEPADLARLLGVSTAEIEARADLEATPGLREVEVRGIGFVALIDSEAARLGMPVTPIRPPLLARRGDEDEGAP